MRGGATALALKFAAMQLWRGVWNGKMQEGAPSSALGLGYLDAAV